MCAAGPIHRRSSSFPSPITDLWVTGEEYDGRGHLSQTRPLEDGEEGEVVQRQLSMRENSDVFHSLSLNPTG